MDSKSETFIQPNGAKVEVGTISVNDKDFAALGCIIDPANGIACGYVSCKREEKHIYSGVVASFTTWEGKDIAPLICTGKWTSYVPNAWHSVTMYSWRATIDGKVYFGRNIGPGMFIRMRAKRKV